MAFAAEKLNSEGQVVMGEDTSAFVNRHIGSSDSSIREMLKVLGLSSLDELVDKTIPKTIRLQKDLSLPQPETEANVLRELKEIAERNISYRSYIGFGFYNSILPSVIKRNILENPGWYTQYTPYQAEIAQGRLEALLNFQTMICELTGMQISNASLLDEATAAAETMTLCARCAKDKKRNRFFVSSSVHETTIEVVKTRANALGFEVVVGDIFNSHINTSFFGVLVQYPTTDGVIEDYSFLCERLHQQNVMLVAACDLLSLTLLKPPGEWGADVSVGSTQRFGLPCAFGGPHAAYFAVREEYKREMPGRIVGVSHDMQGKPALRLAIQTREQHIRRERATSNICTSQVLLAVISSFYALYHGPLGLISIAERIHRAASVLAKVMRSKSIELISEDYFDTLHTVPLGGKLSSVLQKAEEKRVNLRVYSDDSVGISLDETVSLNDLLDICHIFGVESLSPEQLNELWDTSSSTVSESFIRQSSFMQQEIFSRYHSEHEMLRYIKRLESKDLSLTTSMIPLGSCTMKLNAASEMLPITWDEFANIHPYAPKEQTLGYKQLCFELEAMLAEITGMAAVSLQPNAGAQGEYTGLLVIRAYYQAKGEAQRRVCLIPHSAHGTNPASAALAGFRVIEVDCDKLGNVSLQDLRLKAEKYKTELAALMVTYPSTHGVFEESIIEICEIIHSYGAQVYMDGANMNAQVGLCRPGDFGVDICHLNLHKTFSIPHGGGGPGVGPIACAKHLIDFLPSHCVVQTGGIKGIGAVSSAPYGSAGVLPIPWVYIRLMGASGLEKATKVAILNANYIAARLEPYFPVLYKGKNRFVAHECILDMRELKRSIGIEVGDIAKRLMDFNFHAPTVSFPVAETLMIEPTESESKEELDRFCEAMITIAGEIKEIKDGHADANNNVLKNAPHTISMTTADDWIFPYSREKAAFPAPYLREFKFWASTARIDNTWGDRNLCCCIKV